MEPKDEQDDAGGPKANAIQDWSFDRQDHETTAHLQYLIRAFTTQILYGCQGPVCGVPTCRTYQQRVNKGTFRRPHPLTARFQAHILATEPNAEQILCRNAPILPWWSLNLAHDLLSSSSSSSNHGDKLQIQPLNSAVFTPKDGRSAKDNHYAIEKSPFNGNQLAKFALWDFWKNSLLFLGENRYDSKSLSQCLLQTEAFKSMEWSFLPSQCVEYVRENTGQGKESSTWFFTMKIPAHTDEGLQDQVCSDSELTHATLLGELKRHSLEPGDDSLSFKKQHGWYNIEDLLALKRLCKDMQIRHTVAGRSGTWKTSYPLVWQRVSDTLQHILTSPNALIHLDRTHNGNQASCDLILEAFDWHGVTPNLILSYLQRSLQRLCNPPIWLLKEDDITTRKHGSFVNNEGALRICILGIYALVAFNGNGLDHASNQEGKKIDEIILSNDKWGDRYELGCDDRKCHDIITEALDGFDYDPAINMAGLLVRVIARRNAFDEMQEIHSGRQSQTFLDKIVAWICGLDPSREGEQQSKKLRLVWISWLGVLFRKSWRSNWVLNRWETAGAVAEHLNAIFQIAPFYENLTTSNLSIFEKDLSFDWLDLQFDFKDVLSYHNYAKLPTDPNKMHLLELPYLFNWTTVTTAFRSVNVLRAMESHGSNEYVQFMMRYFDDITKSVHNNSQFIDLLLKTLRVSLSSHLQVRIRRDAMLEDTFTQFWGREPREMIKPLKVIFSNEKGTDLGGLSNEFFHLAFQHALDPKHGLFQILDDSKMCWFQPLALEPLATYELLGALMALAIYNGIPTPLPLPFIFYYLLQSTPTRYSLYLIKDGWPTLHKNLSEELGDLGLNFTFTFEANGSRYCADMFTRLSEDICLLSEPFYDQSEVSVSSGNQERYRELYIHWMVKKSVEPQFEAFRKGFLSILPAKVLRLLTPMTLYNLALGKEIDFETLKEHTSYQGDYSADHQTIQWFWEILEEMTQEERRKFQLFVFANDKISLSTLSNYWLTITRPMDNSEERFPFASTCTGTLQLPTYRSREKLERQLKLALESEGFHFA